MNYGTITIEELITQVNTYISTPSRDAQHSAQIYECIISSLTEEGKQKISHLTNLYTINRIISGALLFQSII